MMAGRFTYRRRTGFTFIEMLAAMVFIGIVIPVAIDAILTSNRLGKVANQKRVAAQLAEEMLTELAVTGDWIDTESEGDFGEDWPGYRWEFVSDDWDTASMRLLTLNVYFVVQQKEYSVSLSTLVTEEE